MAIKREDITKRREKLKRMSLNELVGEFRASDNYQTKLLICCLGYNISTENENKEKMYELAEIYVNEMYNFIVKFSNGEVKNEFINEFPNYKETYIYAHVEVLKTVFEKLGDE